MSEGPRGAGDEAEERKRRFAAEDQSRHEADARARRSRQDRMARATGKPAAAHDVGADAAQFRALFNQLSGQWSSSDRAVMQQLFLQLAKLLGS